jgi:hypothetical protein
LHTGPAGEPVAAGTTVVRVRTVDDVIDRLEQIAAALPPGDGVGAFAQMYLETTRQVDQALAGRRFADKTFLTRLDVVFAGLFVSAWQRYGRDPGSVPKSWRALFDARSAPGIHPLQFAVAGMNAHINYDLALALVTTAQEAGGELDDDRRTDFVAVNGVLAGTAPAVRAELLTGPFAFVDDALGPVDDRLSMWAIERARDVAWAAALAAWAVRGTVVEDVLSTARDRMVQLSSQLLLAPA